MLKDVPATELTDLRDTRAGKCAEQRYPPPNRVLVRCCLPQDQGGFLVSEAPDSLSHFPANLDEDSGGGIHCELPIINSPLEARTEGRDLGIPNGLGPQPGFKQRRLPVQKSRALAGPRRCDRRTCRVVPVPASSCRSSSGSAASQSPNRPARPGARRAWRGSR